MRWKSRPFRTVSTDENILKIGIFFLRNSQCIHHESCANPQHSQRIAEENFEILFGFSSLQDFNSSIIHWKIDASTTPVLPENDGILTLGIYQLMKSFFLMKLISGWTISKIFVSGGRKIPTYLKRNPYIPNNP